jgi:hypothetical protein
LSFLERTSIDEWESVKPLIEEALEYNDGEYTSSDIKKMVEDGDMQLWLFHKEDGLAGCGVTQLIDFPLKRICLIVLLAGRDFSEWERYIGVVENWAVSNGCSSIELRGRKGWERVLKDWKKINIVMRKDLHENLH